MRFRKNFYFVSIEQLCILCRLHGNVFRDVAGDQEPNIAQTEGAGQSERIFLRGGGAREANERLEVKEKLLLTLRLYSHSQAALALLGTKYY